MALPIENYFLIPTLVWLSIFVLAIVFRKEFGNKTIWTALIIFSGISFLFIGDTLVRDTYYQWKVNQFTDVDGTYRPEDLTAEQLKYTELVINDTGRNFSIFLSPIFAAIISIFYLIVAYLYQYLKEKSAS